MISQIPLGFRFEPTDEELVRGFLYPRVIGSPLPWNGVVYKPLYGPSAEPWEVFSGDFDGYWQTMTEGGATKSTTYVFTDLIRVRNSKRISRTAGGGTWGGQTGPKKVFDSDSGETIGNKRMLSFEHPNAGASSEFGHWIMHEYVLSDDVVKMIGIAGAGDIAVCKITRCVKNSGVQPQYVVPLAIEDNQETGAAGESLVQEVQEPVCKKQKSCGSGGFTEVAAIPEAHNGSWVSCGSGGFTEVAAIPETQNGPWVSCSSGGFTEVAAIPEAQNSSWVSCGSSGFTEEAGIPEVDDSWLISAFEHDGGGSFTAAADDESFDIDELLGLSS